MDYFLGDALGSVRQLADNTEEVTLAKSYAPYGEVTYSAGNGASEFAFTGEQTDPNGLTYLRARYYSVNDGRFLSRDTWGGDYNNPLSLNRWMYVEGNPVNYTDPSGYIKEGNEAADADKKVKELKAYNVNIVVDWGYRPIPYFSLLPESVKSNYPGGCYWEKGNWRNAYELEVTLQAVKLMAEEMGGPDKFKAAMQGHRIDIVRLTDYKNYAGFAPHPALDQFSGEVELFNGAFNSSDERAMGYVVHELAHVWDFRKKYELSNDLATLISPYKVVCQTRYCTIVWDPDSAIMYFPTKYSKTNKMEYWAEAFTVYMFPSLATLNPLSPDVNSYIVSKIKAIP